MEIIVGTIIVKDNKVLMIKEAKKDCFGKWSFPAGHLEKNETIFEGAERETLEETGYRVELKKVFPIITKNTQDLSVLMLHFLADVIDDKLIYNTQEILERKWIDINDIKGMKENEFRNFSVVKQIIEELENSNFYDLAIIKNL